MKILAPYRSTEKTAPELHFEKLSQDDNVERAGYVPAEKKIQSYMESGLLLQNYRGSSQEYDYEGVETDTDPDSPEYVEELGEDSEKDGLTPLPQFNDRMQLLEQATELQTRLETSTEERKRETQTRKSSSVKEKAFIETLSSSVAKGVADAIETKASAEGAR